MISDSDALSKAIVIGNDSSGNPVLIGLAYHIGCSSSGYLVGGIDSINRCIYSACDLRGTFECITVNVFNIVGYA